MAVGREGPSLVYRCAVLDRYSVAARRAVHLAGEEARRLGHPHIGTEHLLLGLLAEGSSASARLVRSAGAPLNACREKVVEALARRDLPPPPSSSGQFEFSDRAARALDRAGKLSLRLKSEEVSTAHVLMSVLDVEGTAGQVLRGLNVDVAALRDAVERAGEGAGGVDLAGEGAGGADLAGEGAGGADMAGATEFGDVPVATTEDTEPVCATCGSALRATLTHTPLTSSSGVEFDVAFCSACGSALGAQRAPVGVPPNPTTTQPGPAREKDGTG